MKTILTALAIILMACTKPEQPTLTKTTRTSVDTSFSPALSIAVTLNAVVTSGTMEVFYYAADSTILHADLYPVGSIGVGYTVYQKTPCTRFVMTIRGTGDIKSYTLSFK